MMRPIIILLFIVNCIPQVLNAQWSKVNSLSATLVQDIVYEDVIYVATNGGVWTSVTGGASWTNISNGLTGDALQTHEILLDGPSIYIATVEGNYKTTNGGLNWIPKNNGIPIGPGATKRFCYSIFRYNGALFCGAFAGLYKSTDDGDSWTLSGFPGPHSFVEEMHVYNGDLWAGSTNTTIMNLQRTTNDGANWIPVQYFGQFNPEVFCFLTTPQNKLFIGTGHGVYSTTNNGANWTQHNNGLPSDPYISSLVQRGNTIIGSGKFGARGIFVTTNDGLSWDTAGTQDGLPFLSDMYELKIIDDTLYLGASNGLYKRNLNEIITGVTQISSGIPDKFDLLQNYPNPFNPSTTIEFDISESGPVSLTVYDITGREVAQLINENLNPGTYSRVFQADDLTSGIYFYKLNTGEYTAIRKMALIK